MKSCCMSHEDFLNWEWENSWSDINSVLSEIPFVHCSLLLIPLFVVPSAVFSDNTCRGRTFPTTCFLLLEDCESKSCFQMPETFYKTKFIEVWSIQFLQKFSSHMNYFIWVMCHVLVIISKVFPRHISQAWLIFLIVCLYILYLS